jgi:hypothetical protein
MEKLKNIPAGMTPKGKKIPYTVEDYKYLLDLIEKRMLLDKAVISDLKSRINVVESKLNSIKLQRR